ncbi:MAG: archease [Bryobacteraceae bacterium]
MFEVLEHTADVGFRAFGSTLEDLFANAAVAMLSIAGEPSSAEPRDEYPLEAEGGDLESLLVNWLSEVLWWHDGRRIAFREFRVTHLEPVALRATGYGEPRDPARHRARIIVKAVTWHQLKIAQSGGGWTAEVYLDI